MRATNLCHTNHIFKPVQPVLEKVSKRVLVFTAMTALLSACGGSSGSDPDTGAAIGSTSSAGNDTAEDIDSNVATDTGSNGSTGSESNTSAISESNGSADYEADEIAGSELDGSADSEADALAGSESNGSTDSEPNGSTDSESNGSTDSESNGSTDPESSASDIRSNTTPDTDLNAESESVQKESNVDTADETDATGSDNTSDNIEPVTARKVEPPTGFAGAIEPVITPSGSDPFSKFQLDDALYTNNVYDGRQLDETNSWKLIFYNGEQDFVRWEVPALLGNNPSPCARAQSTDPLTLSYRLTSRKDSPNERNTFVRAYPAMVVGSMGGRYESWGVECGQSEIILPSAKRHGGSPVFQMERVAEVTGLPVLAGDLDYDIKVSVKADLNTPAANTGVANVFMDSYWHNVSDAELVPGGSSELVNTINGLSSDFTEVWNLNIWFDYPRFEGKASSWTGGFKIGSIDLDQGGNFDVYFKIEGARDRHIPKCRLGEEDNCFLYIGLVATDDNASQNGITVSYTEIADWMQSDAFRDLFLTGALESDTPSARAYEAWRLIDGEANDKSPDPAKRGPRFPDKNHVIGGIHLGSELWYNPDAEPASIEFEALGVEVEGKGQFGLYVEYR